MCQHFERWDSVVVTIFLPMGWLFEAVVEEFCSVGLIISVFLCSGDEGLYFVADRYWVYDLLFYNLMFPGILRSIQGMKNMNRAML